MRALFSLINLLTVDRVQYRRGCCARHYPPERRLRRDGNGGADCDADEISFGGAARFFALLLFMLLFAFKKQMAQPRNAFLKHDQQH